METGLAKVSEAAAKVIEATGIEKRMGEGQCRGRGFRGGRPADSRSGHGLDRELPSHAEKGLLRPRLAEALKV